MQQMTNNYTIYGRDDCEFCVKAVNLCVRNGASFSFVNMTRNEMTKEVLSELLQVSVRTVPQVLLESRYIGGCDDLEKHFQANYQP